MKSASVPVVLSRIHEAYYHTISISSPINYALIAKRSDFLELRGSKVPCRTIVMTKVVKQTQVAQRVARFYCKP
jgi:hypothetical protein